MSGPLRMTKDEMRVGLLSGRRLIQEEWAHPDEIRFVNELEAEAIAVASAWEWSDRFQCELRSVVAAPSAKENPDV
jgi:hypothetical protein